MFGLFRVKLTSRKSIEEVRAEVQERHDHMGGEIATRFTRGNILVQQGAFLMGEDLAYGKEKVTTK